MKKYFLLISWFWVTVSHASLSWECSRYVDGEYQGFTKVSADTKKEAEIKAEQKYKDLDLKFDYVKCK